MSILPSASDTRITGSIFNITGTSQAPPQALAPTEQVSHDCHCEMKLTESLIASKDYTFQATPANPYLCRTSLNRRSRSSALAPRAQPGLPPAYRAQGASIGDVGIIQPSGAFDFFFNINHPADHAINIRCPADFQPLDPLLQEHDISEDDIFSAGSSLSSPSISIRRIQDGPLNGYALLFEPSICDSC